MKRIDPLLPPERWPPVKQDVERMVVQQNTYEKVVLTQLTIKNEGATQESPAQDPSRSTD